LQAAGSGAAVQETVEVGVAGLGVAEGGAEQEAGWAAVTGLVEVWGSAAALEEVTATLVEVAAQAGVTALGDVEGERAA
jgi:hypothetical protein